MRQDKRLLVDSRRFRECCVMAEINGRLQPVVPYAEILTAPMVESVDVAHGYWHVDDYDSGDPGYYSPFIEVHCSVCGYETGAESGELGWTYGDPFPMNYCPSCGAKMDGDPGE